MMLKANEICSSAQVMVKKFMKNFREAAKQPGRDLSEQTVVSGSDIAAPCRKH